jgi:hypothetical protein
MGVQLRGTCPLSSGSCLGHRRCRIIGESECLYIPHGRLPEKPSVFAIELACAFIADLESRTLRVESIHEHPLSRGAKAKLLLELQRTHRSKRTKMVMQLDLPMPAIVANCSTRLFSHGRMFQNEE